MKGSRSLTKWFVGGCELMKGSWSCGSAVNAHTIDERYIANAVAELTVYSCW